MIFETFEFAPEWIKKFAKDNGLQTFSAVFVIRMYPDSDHAKHPILRDRTPDILRCLVGFGDVMETPIMFTRHGGELAPYGFEAVGAQYSQLFKIFIKP